MYIVLHNYVSYYPSKDQPTSAHPRFCQVTYVIVYKIEMLKISEAYVYFTDALLGQSL